MTPARLGTLVALATLALDQGTKLGLFYGTDLSLREPIELGPYANLVLRWNRGISYGLFQQHSEAGRWTLVALSLAASLGLGLWLRRAISGWLAVSLGLIIGGALGNAVDRVQFGAVLDFLHLHAGDWSWYVFNVADVGICAGVAGLFLDGLATRGREPTRDAPRA